MESFAPGLGLLLENGREVVERGPAQIEDFRAPKINCGGHKNRIQENLRFKHRGDHLTTYKTAEQRANEGRPSMIQPQRFGR